MITSSNSSVSDEIVRLVVIKKPSEVKLSPDNVKSALLTIISGFLPSSLSNGECLNQLVSAGVSLFTLRSQKRLIFGVPTSAAIILPDSGITSSAVKVHNPATQTKKTVAFISHQPGTEVPHQTAHSTHDTHTSPPLKTLPNVVNTHEYPSPHALSPTVMQGSAYQSLLLLEF